MPKITETIATILWNLAIEDPTLQRKASRYHAPCTIEWYDAIYALAQHTYSLVRLAAFIDSNNVQNYLD